MWLFKKTKIVVTSCLLTFIISGCGGAGSETSNADTPESDHSSSALKSPGKKELPGDESGASKSKDGTNSKANKEDRKVRVCHLPPGNPDNAHEIEIDESAVSTHLAHGDLIGKCPIVEAPPVVPTPTPTPVPDEPSPSPTPEQPEPSSPPASVPSGPVEPEPTPTPSPSPEPDPLPSQPEAPFSPNHSEDEIVPTPSPTPSPVPPIDEPPADINELEPTIPSPSEEPLTPSEPDNSENEEPIAVPAPIETPAPVEPEPVPAETPEPAPSVEVPTPTPVAEEQAEEEPAPLVENPSPPLVAERPAAQEPIAESPPAEEAAEVEAPQGSAGFALIGGTLEKNVRQTSASPNGKAWASTWIAANGDLFLFGGGGIDETGSWGDFNALWKFSNNTWTHLSGLSRVRAPGIWGQKKVESIWNHPSARELAMTWQTSDGSVYIYGGGGIDSSGTWGHLNDLWKYNGTNWVWIDGSNQRDIFTDCYENSCGLGSRLNAATFVDTNDNLWLFGGYGFHKTNPGYPVQFNDLYKYDGRGWQFVKGNNLPRQKGVYGTRGVAASTNMPGARQGANYWTDKNGNFWIFGGTGYDAFGYEGHLNDLWKFDGTNWTWMGGSYERNKVGNYGVKGVAAPTNIPGSRVEGRQWTDKHGNLWLFGGYGRTTTHQLGRLNDLWKFDGTNWTWVRGSNEINHQGSVSQLGEFNDSNTPHARDSYAVWYETVSDSAIIYGGIGATPNGAPFYLGDMWMILNSED